MSDKICELDPASAGELPATNAIFSSAKVVEPITAAVPTKLPGGRDSAQNSHSSRKAPGGHDAAQQMDGG